MRNVACVIQFGAKAMIGSIWQRFERCTGFDTQCIWMLRRYEGLLSPSKMSGAKIREHFKRWVQTYPQTGPYQPMACLADDLSAMTKDLVSLFKAERTCIRQLFMLYLGVNHKLPTQPDPKCCNACHLRFSKMNGTPPPRGLKQGDDFLDDPVPRPPNTVYFQETLLTVDRLNQELTRIAKMAYESADHRSTMRFDIFWSENVVQQFSRAIRRNGVGNTIWPERLKWAFTKQYVSLFDKHIKAFFEKHRVPLGPDEEFSPWVPVRIQFDAEQEPDENDEEDEEISFRY